MPNQKNEHIEKYPLLGFQHIETHWSYVKNIKKWRNYNDKATSVNPKRILHKWESILPLNIPGGIMEK